MFHIFSHLLNFSSPSVNMYLRRWGKVIFSRNKPPMDMLFWNICSLEQLTRELNRWLEGDIPEGEKIRSIERYDFRFGWVKIKNDKQAREMMFGVNEIQLIVAIS